jgi:hypothetical protein
MHNAWDSLAVYCNDPSCRGDMMHIGSQAFSINEFQCEECGSKKLLRQTQAGLEEVVARQNLSSGLMRALPFFSAGIVFTLVYVLTLL